MSYRASVGSPNLRWLENNKQRIGSVSIRLLVLACLLLSACRSTTPSKSQPSTSITADTTTATGSESPQATGQVTVRGANLLTNGGFESGQMPPWESLNGVQITTQAVHSGQYGTHVTAGEVVYKDIPVTPGKTYVFRGWFKWDAFNGQGWGDDRIKILSQDGSRLLGVLAFLHILHEKGQWSPIAVTFTPDESKINLVFGIEGPKDQAELYFDDFELFQKSGNTPPDLAPKADNMQGSAPFKVSFHANTSDPDGAVKFFQWDFGDGSVETISNPTHTYLSRGSYTVQATVWDNELDQASQTLQVQVTDDQSPLVTITSPAELESVITTQASIDLTGQAQPGATGKITSLVWDNISTDETGLVDVSALPEWKVPEIRLKPGRNEILITATDDQERTSACRLMVTRQVTAPQVSNIQSLTPQVSIYDKYEFTFDLQTAADTPFFWYEENPPPGIPPKTGVSVEGIFTSASGKILHQPGFMITETVHTRQNDRLVFTQTGNSDWAVRFSPQEAGEYQVKLHVQDASGSVETQVGSFTALPPKRSGFIQVSKTDPRYFEFTNGELYWPIGPAYGPDYSLFAGSGVNFERPWLASTGAYSTNFARWISSARPQGNEGHASQLSFKEHYPGHELSQELFYPEGFQQWIGFDMNPFWPVLKAGTPYQVKLRLKTFGLQGPVDPSAPYGLVIKTHGWPSGNWPDPNFPKELRKRPSIIPPVDRDRDWHTILTTYTPTDEDAKSYISLILDNVSAGQAWIDEFSMREILPDGKLGGEIIPNARADMHTYVDQAPAGAIDQQLIQGERYGIYFIPVIHDKNDWIQNHLNETSHFSPYTAGYYQPTGSKARWLLEQWWRYAAARWGYSSAILGWELNNEGPPNNIPHFQMAQDFAHFMHNGDSHPHPASTSFWYGWEGAFWSDRQLYPDIGLANMHTYLTEEKEAAYDLTAWYAALTQNVYQTPLGIPILLGEMGISYPGTPLFDALKKPNSGDWYHDLLWVQLGPQPMFNPNYWWHDHIKQIDQLKISQAFGRFVQGMDLNQGGYQDIKASVDNPNLFLTGQKNPSKNTAHLWIQNRLHTWRNTMGWDNPLQVTPQSGKISFALNPNQDYRLEWWDTTSGEISHTEEKKTQENGFLSITIINLESDLALKIFPK